MDQKEIFPITPEWIKKSVAWADHKFPYMAYFDPDSTDYPYGGFDHVLFAGKSAIDLSEIKNLPAGVDAVGVLGYDLKNRFEHLESANPSLVACPDSVFFVPALKISFKAGHAEIMASKPHQVFEETRAFQLLPSPTEPVTISPGTGKEEYLQTVQQIISHIKAGDIYEMNYCMAFQASFTHMDPVDRYFSLKQISPMPFGVLFKATEKYVLGASPERFLKRTGQKIIAQPIKGTTRRGLTPGEDQSLRQKLQSSEKERAENLMIVDLMRNDLSKISLTGSVRVEELFGVYPFAQVSQMISTVSSTLKETLHFEDIVRNTFPMGSMTGAPKIRCMELIDRYENFRRGWFSGSIGYISANQDFDFNVVIRSIMLDKNAGKLFFAVGSAITYDADPLQEYMECMLKAKPIFDVLQGPKDPHQTR